MPENSFCLRCVNVNITASAIAVRTVMLAAAASLVKTTVYSSLIFTGIDIASALGLLKNVFNEQIVFYLNAVS